MNIAYYYHDLPRPSDMLFSTVVCGENVMDTNQYLPEWIDSNIDVFIVVGVTDDSVRQLYEDARSLIVKTGKDIEEKSSGTTDKTYFDCMFKRLYRFDNTASAHRFINWLTSDDESDYEDFTDYHDATWDAICGDFFYEEPKTFARELTMKDWEPGGVFEELMGDY